MSSFLHSFPWNGHAMFTYVVAIFLSWFVYFLPFEYLMAILSNFMPTGHGSWYSWSPLYRKAADLKMEKTLLFLVLSPLEAMVVAPTTSGYFKI